FLEWPHFEGLHSKMIDMMENNSVIIALLDLKLQDDDGSLKSVLNLPVEVLKRYCHLDQVADFANLTLFIYNTNNSVSPTQLSGNTIPYSVKLLLSFLFILVGLIGLVGNMLTVLVIYKTTSLHSHTNYFLASLAISDLLLIIVGVPFDLFHLWRKDRPPAIAGYCAVMSGVMYLIYTIWVLAFFPSLYIGLQFKRVVPDFCGYNRELNSQRGSCDYVTSQNIPFRYPFELTMVVTFVLPLIFIVYCYVRILGKQFVGFHKPIKLCMNEAYLASLNEMARATRVHVPIGSTNSTDSSNPSILYVHTKNFAPPKSQQAQRMVMKMLCEYLTTVVTYL
ncbi:hypothetical protein TELCIR_08405, partial [Teladorsagia circumcincta]